MRIIDTHLHLVYPDRFAYPWLAGAPHIDRPWPVEDYFAEGQPLGIEAALHMEVDVAQEDVEAETRAMADIHPSVVGAIAGCRPEHDDFPARLETLAAMRHVKGLRRILHEAPDDLSRSDTFRANLRRLAAHDLSFDLCLRHDQLPIGMELVDATPGQRFVLDHCGVPDITGAGLDPWRAHIAEFAERESVVAKISGIVAYAGPDWTVETLRPYAEHVIACFGWDRVVWGSDHPVCTRTASLTRWVDATHAIVAGASEDERAKLFHRNAERVYRL